MCWLKLKDLVLEIEALSTGGMFDGEVPDLVHHRSGTAREGEHGFPVEVALHGIEQGSEVGSRRDQTLLLHLGVLRLGSCRVHLCFFFVLLCLAVGWCSCVCYYLNG